MAANNTALRAVDTADLAVIRPVHRSRIHRPAGLVRGRGIATHEGGVRSMIDMTTFDLDLDISMLDEVSRRPEV